jgi:hypothetical protein
VVARPGARDLAEREGLEGIRAALSELIDRVAGSAAEDQGAAERRAEQSYEVDRP